jgi:TP901 family phage tail tape measure protein
MALGGGTSGGGGSGSASPNAIKAGEAFVELSANDKPLQKVLQGVVNKIKRSAVMMRQIGLGATAAGLGILTPLIGATKVFANFDDQMRMVKAVVGANNEEFERLNNLSKNLGQTTSFTAAQVAGLMVELGKAGFTVNEIEGMTESILDLARASGTDATLAAEIFGSTMRQFGLNVGESQRIVDVLTASANKSAISVSDLGESFKYAGPVLADLNLSLEDSAALVGVLGNLGIKGSDAGTALRRLGIILSSQPEKIKAAFNVDTMDMQGNLRPIVDILDEIFAATKDMGTGERAKALGEIFGMLTITSASALSKSGISIRKFADELRAMEITSKDVATEMDAGIGGAFRRLRGSVEGAVIAIGDAFAPVLIEIGGYLTPIIKTMIDWIKGNKELVAGIGIFGIALTAGGAALAAFGFAISGVIAGVSALGTILGVVFSPFLLKIAAITAIMAGLSYIIIEIAGTTDLLGDMFENMGKTFSLAWGGILAALKAGDINKALEIAWLGIKILWNEGLLFLAETWEGLVTKTLPELWENLVDTLKRIWNNFVKGIVTSIATAILRVFEKLASLPGGGTIFGAQIAMLRLLLNDYQGVAADAASEQTAVETWVESQRRMLERLKKELNDKLKAVPAEEGLAVAPPPRAIQEIQQQAKMNNNLAMLAASVKGTFGSANYAGAFGIGGKNELEKQTGLLKSIDKKLDKLDVPVWE